MCFSLFTAASDHRVEHQLIFPWWADALIELVNVKMHTVKKIAAAQVTELAESNGSDDKHDDSRRRRKTENGSDDAQADNGSDDEQAQNGSDDGQASDEQAGLFGTEVTDKKLKRKPKDPQMVTTAATVLHDLHVDQAWQNCDLPSELQVGDICLSDLYCWQ